jgi:plastocyanin
MRKLLVPAALAALTALVLGAPAFGAVTKVVPITSAGFVPTAVTIDVGDSITWTNADSENHQPISQSKDAAFASPILRPGESFTERFVTEGKFTIVDAAFTRFRMTVTVKKAAPASPPSLAASRTTVVYGGSVVLTGKLPVTRAGDKISLHTEVLLPDGKTQSSVLGETITDGLGAFNFITAPTAQTSYSVVWRGVPAAVATSRVQTVAVAPRLGLTLVRRVGSSVTFSLKAASAIPYLGHAVFVQRRNALGQWVSLKRVLLKSNTAATRASVGLPAGLSRIRVLMPRSQAGTGYVTGVSRVILVRL